jgi:hypothetical protein
MSRLALLALVLVACEAAPPPAVEVPIAELEPVFVPASASGPRITLTPSRHDAQTLALNVEGSELSNVYGVAFRVRFDPAVLRFQRWVPAADFSKEIISVARANQHGVLVGAVTGKGTFPGLNLEKRTLGTIELALLTTAPTAIDFVADRSEVIQVDGSRATVQWRGGAIQLNPPND